MRTRVDESASPVAAGRASGGRRRRWLRRLSAALALAAAVVAAAPWLVPEAWLGAFAARRVAAASGWDCRIERLRFRWPLKLRADGVYLAAPSEDGAKPAVASDSISPSRSASSSAPPSNPEGSDGRLCLRAGGIYLEAALTPLWRGEVRKLSGRFEAVELFLPPSAGNGTNAVAKAVADTAADADIDYDADASRGLRVTCARLDLDSENARESLALNGRIELVPAASVGAPMDVAANTPATRRVGGGEKNGTVVGAEGLWRLSLDLAPLAIRPRVSKEGWMAWAKAGAVVELDAVSAALTLPGAAFASAARRDWSGTLLPATAATAADAGPDGPVVHLRMRGKLVYDHAADRATLSFDDLEVDSPVLPGYTRQAARARLAGAFHYLGLRGPAAERSLAWDAGGLRFERAAASGFAPTYSRESPLWIAGIEWDALEESLRRDVLARGASLRGELDGARLRDWLEIPAALPPELAGLVREARGRGSVDGRLRWNPPCGLEGEFNAHWSRNATPRALTGIPAKTSAGALVGAGASAGATAREPASESMFASSSSSPAYPVFSGGLSSSEFWLAGRFRWHPGLGEFDADDWRGHSLPLSFRLTALRARADARADADAPGEAGRDGGGVFAGGVRVEGFELLLRPKLFEWLPRLLPTLPPEASERCGLLALPGSAFMLPSAGPAGENDGGGEAFPDWMRDAEPAVLALAADAEWEARARRLRVARPRLYGRGFFARADAVTDAENSAAVDGLEMLIRPDAVALVKEHIDASVLTTEILAWLKRADVGPALAIDAGASAPPAWLRLDADARWNPTAQRLQLPRLALESAPATLRLDGADVDFSPPSPKAFGRYAASLRPSAFVLMEHWLHRLPEGAAGLAQSAATHPTTLHAAGALAFAGTGIEFSPDAAVAAESFPAVGVGVAVAVASTNADADLVNHAGHVRSAAPSPEAARVWRMLLRHGGRVDFDGDGFAVHPRRPELHGVAAPAPSVDGAVSGLPDAAGEIRRVAAALSAAGEMADGADDVDDEAFALLHAAGPGFDLALELPARSVHLVRSGEAPLGFAAFNGATADAGPSAGFIASVASAASAVSSAPGLRLRLNARASALAEHFSPWLPPSELADGWFPHYDATARLDARAALDGNVLAFAPDQLSIELERRPVPLAHAESESEGHLQARSRIAGDRRQSPLPLGEEGQGEGELEETNFDSRPVAVLRLASGPWRLGGAAGADVSTLRPPADLNLRLEAQAEEVAWALQRWMRFAPDAWIGLRPPNAPLPTASESESESEDSTTAENPPSARARSIEQAEAILPQGRLQLSVDVSVAAPDAAAPTPPASPPPSALASSSEALARDDSASEAVRRTWRLAASWTDARLLSPDSARQNYAVAEFAAPLVGLAGHGQWQSGHGLTADNLGSWIGQGPDQPWLLAQFAAPDGPALRWRPGPDEFLFEAKPAVYLARPDALARVFPRHGADPARAQTSGAASLAAHLRLDQDGLAVRDGALVLSEDFRLDLGSGGVIAPRADGGGEVLRFHLRCPATPADAGSGGDDADPQASPFARLARRVVEEGSLRMDGLEWSRGKDAYRLAEMRLDLSLKDGVFRLDPWSVTVETAGARDGLARGTVALALESDWRRATAGGPPPTRLSWRIPTLSLPDLVGPFLPDGLVLARGSLRMPPAPGEWTTLALAPADAPGQPPEWSLENAAFDLRGLGVIVTLGPDARASLRTASRLGQAGGLGRIADLAASIGSGDGRPLTGEGGGTGREASFERILGFDPAGRRAVGFSRVRGRFVVTPQGGLGIDPDAPLRFDGSQSADLVIEGATGWRPGLSDGALDLEVRVTRNLRRLLDYGMFLETALGGVLGAGTRLPAERRAEMARELAANLEPKVAKGLLRFPIGGSLRAPNVTDGLIELVGALLGETVRQYATTLPKELLRQGLQDRLAGQLGQ